MIKLWPNRDLVDKMKSKWLGNKLLRSNKIRSSTLLLTILLSTSLLADNLEAITRTIAQWTQSKTITRLMFKLVTTRKKKRTNKWKKTETLLDNKTCIMNAFKVNRVRPSNNSS